MRNILLALFLLIAVPAYATNGGYSPPAPNAQSTTAISIGTTTITGGTNGQGLIQQNGNLYNYPFLQTLPANRAPQYNDDSTQLIDATHGTDWKDNLGQIYVNAVNTASHAVWNILSATGYNAYPCDAAGGCYTAYGVKQLVGNYVGAAFQLIRASDSATKDIGFVNGVADFASGDGFCTGTTCKFAKFYNQTANAGHDCIPYTANAQPNYSTMSVNGLRGIVLDGVYQQTLGSGVSKSCLDSGFSVNSQSLSMFFVGEAVDLDHTQMMAGQAGTFFYGLNQAYYWYSVGSTTKTNTVGAFTNSPSVWGMVASASSVSFYSDDRPVTTSVGAYTSATYAPMSFLNNVSSETSYSGVNGMMWGWMTFNSALSTGAAASFVQNLYSYFPIIPQLRNQLFLIGDSLTEGAAAQWALNFSEQLRRLLPNPVRTVNMGKSGQYCSYFASGGTGATNNYTAGLANGSKNTIILWCGTNDITVGGLTPAQAYANLQGAIAYLRGVDTTDPILVMTMIDRQNGTYQTSRVQFNADVTAGFSPGTPGTSCSNPTVCTAQGITPICTAGASCVGNIYLVPLGSDPLLGQNGSSANTTYFYTDVTHLTALGYSIVASDIKAVLDQYGIVP